MKKRGRGRKERSREKKTASQRESNKRCIEIQLCINATRHRNRTAKPEANNATLVTLMLTTNDMFEVFFFSERNSLCIHTC